MNETRTLWLSGPIALIGFILMLVFLSGCATQHEYLGHGYHRFVKPNCEVCGTTKNVQGCHVMPQSVIKRKLANGIFTEAEAKFLLDDSPENIKSLCRGCHGYIQHIGNNFKRWNVNVDATIKSFKEGAE